MSAATELKVAPVEAHDVHELAGHEMICELRKTNMVLYGMFVEIVREFYRWQTPYIIGVPDVRWDKSPQTTGIWIDSELNWNSSHPEFVPAVYVKLGDVQYGGIAGPGQPVFSGMNLKDGIFRRTRVAQSSVTFVHVGGTAGEACMLCDNTRSYLSDFSGVICRDYAFSKFYEQGATPIRQYQPDSKEKWQSSTTFALEWDETTSLKLESPILRSIDLIGLDPDDLQRLRGYGILSSRQGKPDQNTKGER